MLLEHFLEVLQKHPFSLLPQIPQNWEGSGVLMGRVFSENPTLFLETVTLTPWSFWTHFESKMTINEYQNRSAFNEKLFSFIKGRPMFSG